MLMKHNFKNDLIERLNRFTNTHICIWPICIWIMNLLLILIFLPKMVMSIYSKQSKYFVAAENWINGFEWIIIFQSTDLNKLIFIIFMFLLTNQHSHQ